nr:hypothetical protein [Photorhabdus hindustanensis]
MSASTSTPVGNFRPFASGITTTRKRLFLPDRESGLLLIDVIFPGTLPNHSQGKEATRIITVCPTFTSGKALGGINISTKGLAPLGTITAAIPPVLTRSPSNIFIEDIIPSIGAMIRDSTIAEELITCCSNLIISC